MSLLYCLKGPGRGEEEMNRQRTEGFQSPETKLYDIIMVDTCHYTFIQTQRTYNAKREF